MLCVTCYFSLYIYQRHALDLDIFFVLENTGIPKNCPNIAHIYIYILKKFFQPKTAWKNILLVTHLVTSSKCSNTTWSLMGTTSQISYSLADTVFSTAPTVDVLESLDQSLTLMTSTNHLIFHQYPHLM